MEYAGKGFHLVGVDVWVGGSTTVTACAMTEISVAWGGLEVITYGHWEKKSSSLINRRDSQVQCAAVRRDAAQVYMVRGGRGTEFQTALNEKEGNIKRISSVVATSH